MKKTILILFLFASTFLQAQVRIDTVGYCVLTSNISYDEAVNTSLMNAMQNAAEEINGVDVTTVMSVKERNGVITNKEKVSFISVVGNVQVKKYKNYQSNDTVYTKINAIVYPLYKDSFLRVDGLRGFYAPNDKIRFTVDFLKDGYLYIFDIAEGGIIEEGQPHRAGEHVVYPPNGLEYYAKGHSSTIVFVYLNEPYPFTAKSADFDSYNKWYWKLPLSVRNTPVFKTFKVIQ